MRIIWDRELFHSWGNKPKQKAREKQYNAEYYKRNKWRWLDNVKDKVGKTISKEKQTQKKFQDIAEANLRKAAAKAAAASNTKPLRKSSSAPIDTGGETETKKKSKGRKGSGGGKGKKGGSGGKGKKGGAGGKGKSKKTKARSSSKSANRNSSEQNSSHERFIYDAHGKLIDTQTIQKSKVLRIPTTVKKKTKKKYKDINASQIKKGKKRAKKILKKIKNRRS